MGTDVWPGYCRDRGRVSSSLSGGFGSGKFKEVLGPGVGWLGWAVVEWVCTEVEKGWCVGEGCRLGGHGGGVRSTEVLTLVNRLKYTLTLSLRSEFINQL